ncbi:MAG: HAMP domain-containing histidine kinase [Saccharofermentans sp.]|nr:HAMP domain-containing histidine kinase [Saccharofermentans sp.]
MRRTSIVKPSFKKIFMLRLIVCLLLFALLATVLIKKVGDNVIDKRYSTTAAYHDKLVEYTVRLSETEPGSSEYDIVLNRLRTALAIYQTVDRNYAEVVVGDMTLATDKNTAFFQMRQDEDHIMYFMQDISYLDPVNSYMDGKLSLEEQRRWEDQHVFDPVAEIMYETDSLRYYQLNSAYIDRETDTFIPGVISIDDGGKVYEVDCTPSDTSGYEYVEFGEGGASLFFVSYRNAADLSSEDIRFYETADENGDLVIREEGEFSKADAPWYIGFVEDKHGGVFEYASYTCTVIIILGVASAVVAALILSVVRFQKDKTIWEIFEYRRKTTEAMAHDLKTPLATIMACAESMETDPDPSKSEDLSRKICENVNLMDRKIEDILMLSRSESGNLSVKKESVVIRSLIEERLASFPDMKAEIKGEEVSKITDRKLFSQALDNLLLNSYRYREEGSTVLIENTDEALTISNKTSMVYKDVDALKKPFVKGDSSRGSKGSGLGLAIAENDLDILGYKLKLSCEDGIFKAQIRY